LRTAVDSVHVEAGDLSIPLPSFLGIVVDEQTAPVIALSDNDDQWPIVFGSLCQSSESAHARRRFQEGPIPDVL
jgi:hypothetical protein